MDPYAPCPCGSGKKVKFCCQAILPEMAKIERLQDNNQPRMALQLLDKLLKDHPENGWLVTQRAMALFSEEEYLPARDGLVSFLRKQPEHPLANALLAVAVAEREPLESAKKVIHRAFLKSMSHEPRLVALLAARLAGSFAADQQVMAARQHHAMVLRLAADAERQATLQQMVELDSDSSIPYPLRSVHPVPNYLPEQEELKPAVKKAQRLFGHGCFAEAGDQFEQISQTDSQSAVLQHLIGLMRAWDGDVTRAAEAFQRAMELYEDDEVAIEMGTLAQLMDQSRPDQLVCYRGCEYKVSSVSRLLTRLDNEDRLVRVTNDSFGDDPTRIASYQLLDRPLPASEDFEETRFADLPNISATINLFEVDGDEPASLLIVGVEGERLDEAEQLFENAAGEFADRAESERVEMHTLMPIEHSLLPTRYMPAEVSHAHRQKLRAEFFEQAVEEWLTSPQKVLQDQSPAEAAGNPELMRPLAAALVMLDAVADTRDCLLDLPELRERLQLPASVPFQPCGDTDLNLLSNQQLLRIDVAALPEEQFQKVKQRALLTRHSRFVQRVLKESLNRPEDSEAGREATLSTFSVLSEVASRVGEAAEALEWTQRGYELCRELSASFDKLLSWKMRELMLRIYDPADPELNPLLLHMWNHYGGKVPRMREHLSRLVALMNVEAPWENAIVTPEGGGQPGQSVWTAESEGTAGNERKLWLPN